MLRVLAKCWRAPPAELRTQSFSVLTMGRDRGNLVEPSGQSQVVKRFIHYARTKPIPKDTKAERIAKLAVKVKNLKANIATLFPGLGTWERKNRRLRQATALMNNLKTDHRRKLLPPELIVQRSQPHTTPGGWWQKPALSRRNLKEQKKLYISQGLDWPLPEKPEREISFFHKWYLRRKGHKRILNQPIRRAMIAKNMEKMPKLIADYKASRAAGKPKSQIEKIMAKVQKAQKGPVFGKA